MIAVVLVDEDDRHRNWLSLLLNGTGGFSCWSTYKNCSLFLEELKNLDFNVVVMDVNFLYMDGVKCIKKVLEIKSSIDILILTNNQEEEIVYNILSAGASGYILKGSSPSYILEAIRDIYEGGSPMNGEIARKIVKRFRQLAPKLLPDLTIREIEVLTLLSEGNNYQEIGDRLFVSIDTVRNHIRRLYKKLKVTTNTEAVAKAIRDRIIL